MVVTTLEAVIPADKASILEKTFKDAGKDLDEGIVETFLLQDSRNAMVWRIVTVWKSFETLESMRKRESPPKGVKMFQDIGAQPKLTIYEVKARYPSK